VSPRARVGLIGLVAAGQSGVPRYAVSLLRALDGVAQEYDDLQLRLVTTRAGAERVEPTTLELRVVGDRLGSPRAGARRIVAEQVAAVGEHGDLLHFFDLTGPLLAPRRRFVTTIHDTAAPRLYKRLVHPWAARHATAAVAVSAYARDEAVRVLGADPRSITVIHSGPGFAPSGAAVGDDMVQEPYMLYVGDLTEHKNVGFLVDVFGAAEVPGRLVLVGRQGAGFEALLARIQSSPARDRIVLLHDVDDARLDGLYRHALATALPSRYEGFGFTPLEAMARGCPVLASDLPALREIAGDGAELLPVDAREAWIDAVQRVAVDDSFRGDLRARGRDVAARYSWERTARALCDLFRHVWSRP
jgi:glycosyltransferase involved in cell wall biosynthesis